MKVYTNLQKMVVFILISMTMLACGGSSSSSSSSSSTATPTTIAKMQDPLVNAVAYQDLFKIAETQTDQTALIVDAHGVEGLHITCQTGDVTTVKNGLFKCDGTPINISLGTFQVGTLSSIPKDKIIYTQDILNVPRAATTHPDVTKLSMILQSLDEDADLSNGITITQQSIDLLDNELANFTNLHQMTIPDISTTIDNVITARKADDATVKLTKVSEKEAQINLTNALSNTPVKSINISALHSISV